MLTISAGPSSSTWRWWGASLALLGAAAGVIAFGWPRWLAVATLIGSLPFAAVGLRQTLRMASMRALLHVHGEAIVLGSPFTGEIEAHVPARQFELSLRCLQHVDNGRNTLWEDYRLVTADSTRIPFAFDLPADGISSGRAIDWVLDVEGEGYSAGFRLPVIAAGTPAGDIAGT